MERRSGVPACRRDGGDPARSLTGSERQLAVIWRPRRRPSQHDLGPARRRVLRVVPSCTSVATDDARRRAAGDRTARWASAVALPWRCSLPFGIWRGWVACTRVARRLASRLGYPLRLTPPSVALAARARGTRTRPRARPWRATQNRNKASQRVQSRCRVHRFRDLALGHEHYVCRRARGRCFRFGSSLDFT